MHETQGEDLINTPKHYMLLDSYKIKELAEKNLGLEVRDLCKIMVMRIYSSPYGYEPIFISDYVQMLQYLLRFDNKNGLEDLKKARVYLNEMIKTCEESEAERDQTKGWIGL